jgi:hypothetical protein
MKRTSLIPQPQTIPQCYQEDKSSAFQKAERVSQSGTRQIEFGS